MIEMQFGVPSTPLYPLSTTLALGLRIHLKRKIALDQTQSISGEAETSPSQYTHSKLDPHEAPMRRKRDYQTYRSKFAPNSTVRESPWRVM
jgi:hypothetical protein